MRTLQIKRSQNTRARVTIRSTEFLITIPEHYNAAEEYAFIELCSELEIPLHYPTMRGRDSMYSYLTVYSDSRKIKITVERDMI
jgi:hypothetical protein